MEKTIVLALASGQKQFSASVCMLVEKYAEILASQGLLATAMGYLKLLGSDDLSPELSILRDRIAFSTESGISDFWDCKVSLKGFIVRSCGLIKSEALNA